MILSYFKECLKTNSFHNEEDEWVEISDGSGRKAALRHLATVRFGEKTYLVLGAVRQNADGEDVGGFLLVRREDTPDGAYEYIVTSNEEEIENVVNSYVMQSILMQIRGQEQEDEAISCSCGLVHEAGDFCVCGNPAYLQ